MKKFFTKAKSLQWTLVAITLVTLVAIDMAFHNTETVVAGSFRADNLLNGTPAPATSVAVIASDNVALASPTAVTNAAITFAQVEDMVQQAINMVGGITAYVQSGDTVIIKPNIVDAENSGNGENTDVRVVKAIIRMIYNEYGNACKIYIGEGSARDIATFGGVLWDNTLYAESLLSADPDLAGINFELLDLNDGTTGTDCVHADAPYDLAVDQGGAYWIHKYLVSPNVKFINVPVLKMHQPGITNALKNQIGIAAGAYYGYNKMAGGIGGNELIHHGQFIDTYNYKTWQDEEIIDLCSCIDKFDLNVVDAIWCLETQKTCTSGCGNQVRLNTIIAGADPVAVDHVCLKMIGSNPDDIVTQTLSAKIGLGTNDADSITILGENISRYTYRFDRSGSLHSEYGQGNRTWLISDPFTYINMATEYLASEATLSPSNGDADWSIPYYFFDDRIDLNSFHNNPGTVVTYAFTSVYSPADLSNKELWINSEEDIIIYLNGVEVYSYAGSRPNAEIVIATQNINLVEGENSLLVKTYNSTGCYDFSINIVEPGTDGNRVDGLEFYIKNYNEPAEVNPNATLNTPSNNTQSVELTNAIVNIVYSWSGGTTDVTVAGLPTGVTAVKDMGAKTVTISGTPSAVGTSNYTITTIGGVGGPIISGGSITCMVCASLATLNITGLTPAGNYRLALFDATGTTEIKTLTTGNFTAGDSKFMFSRSGIAAGTYTFKLLNGVTIINSGTVVLP